MESNDKSDNLVVLPSGKTFKRKAFSEYNHEELKDIISQCSNIAHILNTLKLNRVYHYKIKDIIDKYKLSTSHFKVIQKNQYYNYIPNDGKIIRTHTNFKASLLREGKLINKCAICKLEPMWNNKPLTLHLDHINGDNKNNDLNNLRLICPNCHSQTDTYTGRNIKKNKNKNKNDSIINKQTDNVNTIINNITSKDVILETKKTEQNENLKCQKCKTNIKYKSKSGLCSICVKISKRKVERPSYESLINNINELGYVKTGTKYGVSDNAIRKWIKYYNK